ncbi:MAG: hypothetical protein WD009_08050 [Phycisphaeraceae bacterium]
MDRMQQQNGQSMDIVCSFEQWVKQLQQQVAELRDEQALQAVEQQVRSEGQAFLGQLLQGLVQQALAWHEPATRACPRCDIRRRHKGRRPRKLVSSLGRLDVHGVYWQCPACGLGEHALDRWASQTLSPLLVELLSFTAASTTSFAKAEQATGKLMGVTVDEQTLRRVALAEGRRLTRASSPAPPSTPLAGSTNEPQPLAVGSCDGTMVHIACFMPTRCRACNGWRPTSVGACRRHYCRDAACGHGIATPKGSPRAVPADDTWMKWYLTNAHVQ